MKKIRWNVNSIFWFLLLLPYIIFPVIYFGFIYDWNKLPKLSVIIISKSDFTLRAYDEFGKVIINTKVAIGKGIGNKENKGDLKTPEGVFSIADIQDASSWSHDFKDDSLGLIAGAYGPFFIRLNVAGFEGIGIHGTHDASSIGKNVTEGCVRLRNHDVSRLAKLVRRGIPVVILPDNTDASIKLNSKQREIPILLNPAKKLNKVLPIEKVKINPTKSINKTKNKPNIKPLKKEKEKKGQGRELSIGNGKINDFN